VEIERERLAYWNSYIEVGYLIKDAISIWDRAKSRALGPLCSECLERSD
jgi:hypothetical protein